ncbi:hypothetical protein F9C07_5129 [Aspergillus flavus]|uniref:Uncharacterized protein n=1 Tax=Aspergillus flavus (strain ATCC 200026 / FGSC A1120 / IAM 13836 / NRRL 3357 / JCM 12722 / SRRC 167) TaxID=332952 RepID=A0A7U2MLZ5_ASPFN|nr:hypothetical protein F9C07_5129 [Aspergillus flavus]
MRASNPHILRPKPQLLLKKTKFTVSMSDQSITRSSGSGELPIAASGTVNVAEFTYSVRTRDSSKTVYPKVCNH